MENDISDVRKEIKEEIKILRNISIASLFKLYSYYFGNEITIELKLNLLLWQII